MPIRKQTEKHEAKKIIDRVNFQKQEGSMRREIVALRILNVVLTGIILWMVFV